MTTLQEALMRFDLYITQKMREYNVPAMSIGLADAERTLFLADSGMADVGSRRPAIKSTLFQIGSIGKLFTAIAVLQAMEAGALDLHAPVTDYLPWFKVQTPYADPITVHHLLTHTAGIISGMDFTGEHSYEVHALREMPVGSPPGTFFHYSNVGYKALTLILEHISGMAYGDLIQQQILTPLGMVNTLPTILHAQRHRLAVGYTHLYDDRPPLPGRPIAPATWFQYGYGDGSIVSNAEDMVLFIQMMLRRGVGTDGGALITESSFDLLTAPYIPAFGSHHYGYGVIISEFDGLLHFGHGGSMPGFSSMLLLDTVNQLGVVVLTNHSDSDSFSLAEGGLRLLRAAFKNDPLPATPVVESPTVIANAADYAGDYMGETCTLTFVAEGTRLLLRLDDEDIQLHHYRPDAFVVNHHDYYVDAFVFRRDADGAIIELFHGENWYITAAYEDVVRFTVPAEWARYTGVYRSHNPWNPAFRVIIRKGQLMILYPSGGAVPLIPVDEGVFRIGEDERLPERAHFDTLVEGKALRVTLSDNAYYRFFTP